MSFHKLLIAATVLAIVLAACSRGSQSASATASTNGIMTNQSVEPSGSAAAYPPAGGMKANGEAMAPGTFATVPPKLNCGTAAPVWANPHSRVYHLPSDPLYGRTHHGHYMCVADALREGYRLAKPRRHHRAPAPIPSD
ncbi:MAG TPA: hypothetical protein VMF11_08315 [Candidatus Baltobacteraceae bacterium]|nr:hypothetical protein [Candidatus Baltobacteraceae bacterium]